MNERCFDEGTLQAFLDNELASELSQEVARHVANCEPCALALTEVEEETAFVFAAMDEEFNTLVPTQRLWTKINESIEIESRNQGFWHRLSALISSITMTGPTVAAFASLMFVLVSVAVLVSIKSGSDSDIAAARTSVTVPGNSAAIPVAVVPETLPAPGGDRVNDDGVMPPQTVNYRTPSPRTRNASEYATRTEAAPRAERTVYRYLPGEESYVSTIASLEKTLGTSKDDVLRPSARVTFERNLAVVDDAIVKMKAEVRKNPGNEAAKQVLFASYQNKIDLLNSVAEKSELMATLR